jgi:hypothetical protein
LRWLFERLHRQSEQGRSERITSNEIIMMKKSFVLIVAVCAFTIGAQAQAPHGLVYIESNNGNVAGQNSILAFKRDQNGT